VRKSLLLVAIFSAVGCAGGQAATCTDDQECPAGRYCNASNSCTSDCTSAAQCNGLACNDRGKCVNPVEIDAGGKTIDSGMFVDATFDAGTVPDQLPAIDGPITVDQLVDAPPTDGDGPLVNADSNVDTSSDAVLPIDGPPGDFIISPECSLVGKHCNSDLECGSGFCLGTSENQGGVCVCNCTVETDCPTNATCASVPLSNGQIPSLCLQECVPQLGSNSCDSPLACKPNAGRFTFNDTAVCAFMACTTGADCPVMTATVCDTSNPVACSIGQDCVSTSSTTTAGRCANSGSCDTLSGICKPHSQGNATAKNGDPCDSDFDCGNAMQCDLERLVDGVTQSRNGYCVTQGCNFSSTLPQFACPTGSHCNLLYGGGICQKSCDLTVAADCRGNAADQAGDYECRALNNISAGGQQITAGPVCDWGPSFSCDTFSSSGLTCEDVGLFPNSTNMACRAPDGTLKVDTQDPTGYCLDTTSSGL
jgi:hypothetical protein